MGFNVVVIPELLDRPMQKVDMCLANMYTYLHIYVCVTSGQLGQRLSRTQLIGD